MTTSLLLRVIAADGATVTVDAPSDLRFSTVIPGGYDTLAATIPWPRDVPAPQILQGAARVQVVDGRHGGVVWSGRLTDPGDSMRPDLPAYAIAAAGEQSLLDGWRASYALVDRDPASWATVITDGGGEVQSINGPGTLAGWPGDWGSTGAPTSHWEHNVPVGTNMLTGSSAALHYVAAAYHGVGSIAQVTGSVRATKPWTTLWEFAIFCPQSLDTYGPSDKILQQWNLPNTQQDWVIREGNGLWYNGDDVRAVRIGMTFTGVDVEVANSATADHGNLIVYFRRYNREGQITTSDDFRLYAHAIVYDLLGRGLGQLVDADPILDLPTAAVAHAAWWEGVTAREVMAFVNQYGPYMWWAVWGPRDEDPSSRPRFQCSTWQTAPRYHLVESEGVVPEMAGGVDELANRALVIYQAAENTNGHTTAAVEVPILDEQGIERWTTCDVTGSGVMTEAKAQDLGQAALISLSSAKSSGRVTVSGRIYDRVAGRTVEPWEILPGSPVSVNLPGYRPLPTPTSTPDGLSVFRLTAVEYNHGQGEATLTMDGGSRSLATRLQVATAPRRYSASNPLMER